MSRRKGLHVVAALRNPTQTPRRCCQRRSFPRLVPAASDARLDTTPPGATSGGIVYQVVQPAYRTTTAAAAFSISIFLTGDIDRDRGEALDSAQ